jgi:hypothetical protein
MTKLALMMTVVVVPLPLDVESMQIIIGPIVKRDISEIAKRDATTIVMSAGEQSPKGGGSPLEKFTLLPEVSQPVAPPARGGKPMLGSCLQKKYFPLSDLRRLARQG